MVAVAVGPVRPVGPNECRDVGCTDSHGGYLLGVTVGQRNILGRPKFEGDTAAQVNVVKYLEVHESLSTDHRGIHVQVNRFAAGSHFIARRIEFAVAVSIGAGNTVL